MCAIAADHVCNDIKLGMTACSVMVQAIVQIVDCMPHS